MTRDEKLLTNHVAEQQYFLTQCHIYCQQLLEKIYIN